jgi:hypothetical protein
LLLDRMADAIAALRRRDAAPDEVDHALRVLENIAGGLADATTDADPPARPEGPGESAGGTTCRSTSARRAATCSNWPLASTTTTVPARAT